MRLRTKYARAIRLGIELRRSEHDLRRNEWTADTFSRHLHLSRRYRDLEERGGRLYRLARDGYHHWSALPKTVRDRMRR